MKKFVYLILLLLFGVLNAFSQNSVPAPSPTPEAAQEDNDVVRITTNLVQVDVTVTDSKGRLITDLKPGEIEIYENGRKQDITNFSFVNAENKTSEKTAPKTGAPAPPVPLKAGEVKRTYALVVDDLSLSFQSASYTRRALKKFVDEQMQPEDLVAIIRTGSGVGAMQQFTSDKRQLYAVIDRLKWNPNGTGGFGNSSPSPSDSSDTSGAEDLDQFRNDVLAVGTLGAVNYIVRGMRDLPGRKSVVLFSEGFSMDPRKQDSVRVQNALRHLVDMANRAAVVIYTIDTRGLQSLAPSAADSDPASALDDHAKKMDALNDTQFSLSYLARVTGGISFKNNNDINLGIQKVLDDQKGYYLVGFQPDDDTFDPKKRKFNTLSVKVTRPGLKVRYRSGFFGITDEDSKPAKPKTPRDQIVYALTSPFATGGIKVGLTPIFTNDQKNGSYISSLIHVNASDLHFTDEPDGWKTATFEIVAIVFGDNGISVDSLSRTETMRAKGDTFEKLMHDGFVYNVPFPVKKPGAYQMRVAVRDEATSKIGSANQFVEVPDLNKGDLVLSGIIFENVSKDRDNSSLDPTAINANDTADREFHRGTALVYRLIILDPKIDKTTGKPNLKTQVKIFQNGKEIFTGADKDYAVENNSDPRRYPFAGALDLGRAMQAGDYVLQVIVTDTLAKQKKQVKTQWLDFEVVK